MRHLQCASRWASPAALIFLLAWAQAWFLGLLQNGFTTSDRSASPTYEYVEALAHGRSYLPLEPHPELLAAADPYAPEYAKYRYGDRSYYQGRFYWYFGIVPFATLLVPWFKATGTFLTDAAGVWLFSLLGLCAYGGTLCLLWRKCFPRAGAGFVGLALTLMLVANWSALLIARPSMYELASMAAFGCFGTALFATFAVAMLPLQRRLWFGVAGLFLGLTIGCRPNMVPGVAIVGLWLLWNAATLDPAARRRQLAALLLPVAIIGILLAWFNFHRFDSPFEFGFRYQSAGFDRVGQGLVDFSNLPFSLHRYLFGLPRFADYFPFITGEISGPFPLPPRHERTVLLYGCIVCAPALLMSLAVLRANDAARAQRLHRLYGILAAAASGNLLLLGTLGNGCYRYPVDFLAPLSLMAGAGVFHLTAVDRARWRGALLAFAVPATIASGLLLLFQVVSVAKIWSQFDAHRPADFARLAKPFNAVAYGLERLTGNGPRAIRVKLVLPTGRAGTSEPLVVRGTVVSEMDFLFLYYPAPGLITLGFHGGPLSSEIPVEYEKPHVIEVRYGNDLPPPDHPKLADWDQRDIALARRTVTVLLNDHIVLDGWAEFVRTDGSHAIGDSSTHPAYGPKFTGRIEEVSYPPLPIPASPERWTPSAYAPIALTVTTKPMPVGIREPLLSCGHRGQGAQLLLEHGDGNRIRIGWIETNGKEFWSDPIEWSGIREKIILYSGALLPPEGSSLWPAAFDRAAQRSAMNRLQVMVRDQTVIEREIDAVSYSPASLHIGRDELYLLPRVMREFTGEIEAVERVDWLP
jgi:hypothetical protein